MRNLRTRAVRRVLTLTAVPLALAVVLPSAGAHAAPAKAKTPTHSIDLYGPMDSPHPSTGAAQSYTTDLSTVPAGTKIQPQTALPGIDYLTRDECLQHSAAASRDEGYIKNHYAYCQISNTWKIVLSITKDGVKEPVSIASYRTILIGYGNADSMSQDKGRHIAFDLYIDSVKVQQLDPAAPRADEVMVSFSIPCLGAPQELSCIPDTFGTTYQSLAAWNNQKRSFGLSSPEGAGFPDSRELVATGRFNIEVDSLPLPPFLPEKGTASGPTSEVRFDSASYISYAGTSYPYGAVFDKVQPSVLFARLGTNYTAVSQHIWDAFNNPGSTEPPVAGKSVPHVVHRLFWDTVRRQANADQALITCQIYFPGYTNSGKQCDEYPFATTYEGAAQSQYGDPFGRYSARAVPAADNGSAGARLGNWYGRDRILDSDEFLVKVS